MHREKQNYLNIVKRSRDPTKLDQDSAFVKITNRIYKDIANQNRKFHKRQNEIKLQERLSWFNELKAKRKK